MTDSSDSPLNVRSFRKPPETTVDSGTFDRWSSGMKSLSVEIGCGVGFHPISWAKAHPNHGLLAFERTSNKFSGFRRRLDAHPHLTNIFPVHGDARHWIPFTLQTNQVSHYYFIYPNPYPKASQANKRWHRNPLMHYLLETLKPMGTLFFATNESWLNQECLLYMKDFWALDLLSAKEIREPGPESLSHFEKKYLAQGQTCYHLEFQKTKR